MYDGPEAAALIDLDELAAPSAESTVLSRRRRRMLSVGVVLAIALAALGGATAADGGVVTAASVPFDGSAELVIEGRTAIVLESAGLGRAQVVAYTLDGGKRLWLRTVDAPSSVVTVSATPGAVLLTMPSAGSPGDAVEALDLGSGAPLWTRDSLAQEQIVPAGLLTEDEEVPHAAPVAGQPGVMRPRADAAEMVDPTTGAVLWSRPLPIQCEIVPPSGTHGHGWLAEYCPDTGELTVVDPVSGATVASRTLPLASAVVGVRGNSVIGYVGDVVVIGYTDPVAGVTFVAYRAADLSPAWSGHLPIETWHIRECGSDLCESGSGRPDVVIDPTTGASLPAAVPDPGPPALVAVSGAFDYTAVQAGSVPDDARPADPGVMVTIENTTLDPLWIALATADGVRLIASIQDVDAQSCQAVAGYVACGTPNGRLVFLRRR